MTPTDRRLYRLGVLLAIAALTPLGFLAAWCAAAALDGVRHYGG